MSNDSKYIEELRNKYLKGMRIKKYGIPSTDPRQIVKGTVDHVGDDGFIYVNWDGTISGKITPGDPIEILDCMDRLYVCGEIVSHFKRWLEPPETLQENPNFHLYRILSPYAINTDTDEDMVIYQALYSPFLTFARPVEQAKQLVDWNKYGPDVPYEKRQAYRLMPFEIKGE